MSIDISIPICDGILKTGQRCKNRAKYNGKCRVHDKSIVDYKPVNAVCVIDDEYDKYLDKMWERCKGDPKVVEFFYTFTQDDFFKWACEKGIIPPFMRGSSHDGISPILLKYDILSKKDWHIWATKNHPDKGGDTEIFRDVCMAVRLNFN